MSSALAIAATLRVIAAILDNAVGAANLNLFGGTIHTTVQPPDQIEIGSNEQPHLNLFLYTVTMNSGWRNVAASRDPTGARIARPPLAVDLHFLLSAYGATEFHPEILLGLGMQALHEQPFLDRKGIVSTLTSAATPEMKSMATAELDQQVEQVKIAPHDLSADELYKLWSAFGSKCRPSAAYVATVVLINSKGIVKSAPPVMARNIGLVTFERPVIEDVEPDLFEMNGPVQLKLTGSGFQAPGYVAQFGATQAPLQSVTVESALVTVPASVTPGMNLLKVVRDYEIGSTPPDKFIADSNPVGIIVQPLITGTSTPKVAGVQRVVVNFAPASRPDQPAALLLDQLDAAPGTVPNRYAIDALQSDVGPGSILFNASQVTTGKYLLRIRIDGTESVPVFDPNAGFTDPQVTLP
jgi:hypothetical protein